MKKITTLVWLLALAWVIPGSAQQQTFWDYQNPNNVGTWIGNLHFVNDNTGWACSVGGNIHRTTDGGTTWTTVNYGGNSDLYDIFFANSTTGYCGGTNGTMVKSVDGGVTWSPLNIGTTNNISDIFFIDANTGWVALGAGFGGGETSSTILKTTDGGATWTPYAVPVASTNINAIDFVSATVGFAAGNAQRLFKTIDGGVNWTQLTAPTGSQVYYALDAIDANTVVAAGSNNLYMRTTNGGTSWAAVPGIVGASQTRRLCFYTATDGVAVGGGGRVLVTHNAGASWSSAQPIAAPYTTYTLYGCAAVSNAAVYVGGQRGIVAKSTDNGTSWGTNGFVDIGGGALCVNFWDENIGMTGGFRGAANLLLQTTNGGNTWSEVPLVGIGGVGIEAIQYMNANTVLISNSNGTAAGIYKSVNNGGAWTQSTITGNIATSTSNAVTDFAKVDDNLIYACGRQGRFYKSTDGGDTWTVSAPTTYAPSISVSAQAPASCAATGVFALSGLEANQSYNVYYNDKAGNPVGPISLPTNPLGQLSISGLPSGRYTNIRVERNGCFSSAVSTVLVATAAPSFNTASTAPTTCGATDGRITLTGTGAAGIAANTTYAVSYYDDGVLVGPTNMTTNATRQIIINGLDAGVYSTITVMDMVSGCERVSTSSVLLHDPGSTTATATAYSPASCGGSDGGITFSNLVAGTTYAVSYRSNGAVTGPVNITADAAGTASLVNLALGLYTDIHVVNPAGCTRVIESASIGDLPVSDLFSISFPSANTGYMVGNRGIILKTTDGGATWTRQVSAFPATGSTLLTSIWSVHFVDDNIGYFCGITGKVFKTTDGGATWTQLTVNSVPSNSNLQYVYFYDALNGFVCGFGGVLMRTSDGGATWTQDFGISSDSYNEAYAVNERTAYFVATVIPSGGYSIIKQTNSCFPIEVVLTKPSGAANPDAIFCTGESVIMTANQELGASYLWSTGATGTSITVNTPGLYTLDVTYPEGCTYHIDIPVQMVPVPAPVCNDHVQISLDADCSVTVTPDMVLEGDTYCDYRVEVTGLIGVPSYGDVVTSAHIGQEYRVTVTHIQTGNSCWGRLTVEDKLPPVIDCPAPFAVACAETDLTPAHLTALGLPGTPAIQDNCSAVTTTYADNWTDLGCGSTLSAVLTRTWTATDAYNNLASCVQIIDIQAVTLADVVLPSDMTIDCGNGNPAPAASNSPYYLFTYPGGTVTYGFPSGTYCDVQVTHTDSDIQVCDGTYKILRAWKVFDWCQSLSVTPPNVNPINLTQVIKVADQTGPDMTCPPNMTVSTDAYTCCATVNLPDIELSDDCSRINSVSAAVQELDPANTPVITHSVSGTLSAPAGNNPWTPDTLAVLGNTPCLPLTGTLGHLVTYTATDDCGNARTCTFRIHVRDYTPPIAVCDEITTVAIGLDDLSDGYVVGAEPGDCRAGGIVWVPALTFDDGSYDNCGAIHITARRLDLQPECFDLMTSDELSVASAEGDSVKFYCCEVGTTQNVVLTVYQLNANGQIATGPGNAPILNECMVQIQIQDKIKPVCVAPANVQVSCENFDPTLWPYGNAVPSDNCCLDETKTYLGQCGLSHSVSYANFDTVCNRGTIRRTWTVYDCHNLTSTCQQTITVTQNQNYYVRFPKDEVVTTCVPGNEYGAPEFYGEDCELLAVSHVDELFTVVPDACYKIERTWTVINWCNYNSNTACTVVPNPDGETHGKVIVSAPNNGINGWAPSSLPVTASGQTVTYNYGMANGGTTNAAFAGFGGWSQNANCYKYKQIIKIIDNAAPTVVSTTVADTCDYTTNDESMWHHMSWWDEAIDSHNLCEGAVNLSITATDACAGENVKIRYQLYLDTDHDGVMETVVPGSVQAPTLYGAVRYNNYQNQNFGGGEIRPFVSAPLVANNFGFGLQTQVSGDNLVATVRFVNTANVVQNPAVQLPYGTHKIKWIIEDGCGNEKVHETTFTVDDCKKPTVVCTNGVSVNLMNGPMNTVSLWAIDLYEYANDNCTPEDLIKITVVRADADNGSLPTGTSVDFSCADLLPGLSFGTVVVNVYAEDAAGNFDFCAMAVQVQDNMGVCGNGTNASVAGALANEAVQGVEDATVELYSVANGIPATNQVLSNVNGSYMFSNALPLAANATVTPVMDADPLNGVNTWDLVLISRHILGLEPLNTPYKLISADANKSGTVTTFDIVELRKLILGTYQALPNNSSWRFVNKSQVFTNDANPFADVIQENLSIANIQTSISNGDFVAAKIGDVDGTATPNQLVSADDRTAGTLLFDVNDRMVNAGEEFTVQFKAAEKVAGYQFTIALNGLETMDIVPGTNMSMDNFGVFANEITTSADGTDGVFAVTFRAVKGGQLSQMLNVSSRITKAVAFNGENKMDIAFRFNNAGNSTIAGVGFELYQNAPNPFVHKTVVGFHLPESTRATLSVYDETGRILYTTTGNFAKGYNAVQLDRGTLNANGALYYKLETAANSAVKQMIQSK